MLELTERGEAERIQFAAAQRAAFEDITAAWSPEERTRFAQLLVRYVTDAGAWSRHRGLNGE